jgi:hypothetical protein
MKFKITWPAGIAISLLAFVIFILYFVYQSLLPEYTHHLVSEDYYKDGLNFTKELNQQNKGIALKENVSLKKTDEGLIIIFPKEFDSSAISGTIYFQRLSNSKIDFELPINLETNEYLIKNEDLVKGRWDVEVKWIVNDTTYLFKEKIMY